MPLEPLIIVNPVAGGGRAGRLVPWLRDRLAGPSRGRLHVTARAGEATDVARDGARANVARVVAVGGDGTVQEVVNGLLAADGTNGSAPSLGIIPVGSGNDLARSLRLPRATHIAYALATAGHARPIDVARASDRAGRNRWFASAGGIGFDAQVAAAMATRSGWQRGSVGYLLTTLSELRRFSNRHISLTLDGTATELDVLFVAFANGAYYGGGMRIAPDARPDDGFLDVCVVGDVSRLTAIRQIPNLYRGTHVSHRAVAVSRASRMTIEGGSDTLVHLDGEPFGSLPLDVELVAGRLGIASVAPAVR